MKLEGYCGPMCNRHVHSTMTRSSRFHCPIGAINKPTTGEWWISPVYRRLAVAKFFQATSFMRRTTLPLSHVANHFLCNLLCDIHFLGDRRITRQHTHRDDLTCYGHLNVAEKYRISGVTASVYRPLVAFKRSKSSS